MDTDDLGEGLWGEPLTEILLYDSMTKWHWIELHAVAPSAKVCGA